MRGFRFSLLGVVMAAALGLAATGASADGPVYRGSIKDVPPPAPAYIWSGLYVGGSVALGIGTTDLTALGVQVVDVGLKGVQAVGAVGYDWQLSPRWVLGVFGDYASSEIDGTTGGGDAASAIDQQWAVGGRLGLLATPSTLFNASGGYTGASFKFVDGGLVINRSLDGFFVGLGVEQAITRNLSFKVDYRFSDYQDVEDFIDQQNTNFVNEVHSVRIGVNWRFGG
jgi:outer membrane immunogenic protein